MDLISVLFFYDRDNTFEYTMNFLECDFDSYFDGVLTQEGRFRLIRTRVTGTIIPVALLPSPRIICASGTVTWKEDAPRLQVR